MAVTRVVVIIVVHGSGRLGEDTLWVAVAVVVVVFYG